LHFEEDEMLLDSWQEILAALAHNRLRAVLTACGVFWGVFILIVMLGLGHGIEHGTRRNLGGIINRSVFVWPYRTSRAYGGLQPGRYIHFRNDDVQAIAQVRGVADLSPRLQGGDWRDGLNVVYGSTTGSFAVMGEYPAFSRVEPMTIVRGRFISSRDFEDVRKIAVIGSEARRVLMGEADPIGKYIKVKRIYFQIVGEVTSDKTGDPGERVRSTVFIPFSTFQRVIGKRNQVGWFALNATDEVPAERVEAAVRSTLIARHRIHPNDEQAIGSFNVAKKFGQMQSLFRGIEGFVWFVGTLTLLAGMLGVSNILLITVKERTREFGIRKALGATPFAIVSMVIKEAVALASMAGYLGIVAGVGVLAALDRALSAMGDAPITRPEVDFRAAVLAAVLLVVSGAVAGLVPARHAAGISPVEALRAE
jgi:putative ABC transport system permease protein